MRWPKPLLLSTPEFTGSRACSLPCPGPAHLSAALGRPWPYVASGSSRGCGTRGTPMKLPLHKDSPCSRSLPDSTRTSPMAPHVVIAGAVVAALGVGGLLRRFYARGPDRDMRDMCEDVQRTLEQIRNLPDDALATSDAAAKKSPLYTRTGDAGESSLYNAERRPKDDMVFSALGSVDELQAHLALAAEYCLQDQNGLYDTIREIQSRLIDVGSAIGTPRRPSSSERKLKRTEFHMKHVVRLEKQTDVIDSKIPPLRTFILAGGGLAASHIQVARTICRRAERQVVPLVRSGDTEESVGKFLNRLSDMLFASARYATLVKGREEVAYMKE